MCSKDGDPPGLDLHSEEERSASPLRGAQPQHPLVSHFANVRC